MRTIISVHVLLISLFFMATTHAVRNQGDASGVPKLENLINVLMVQQHELEKLMSMLERLDEWKRRLDSENTRLYKEGELAKQDRKKMEQGEMSEQELSKKWHTSGRSLRHDKAIKSFKQDVEGFNLFVKEYNLVTKKMSHVLDKRSPPQVRVLIQNMQLLVKNMKQALQSGNYEKARYIAGQSDIAREFGYVR